MPIAAPEGPRKRTRTPSSPMFVDAGAGVPRDDPLGADALSHGREQHALQIAAMDRELRRRMTGRSGRPARA